MLNNKVLATTRKVVKNSEHVKINLNNIYKFQHEIQYYVFNNWLHQAPFDIFTLSKDDRLNFIAILSSISFCYWPGPKWTIQYKGNEYDGTWALIVSLGQAIINGYPVTDFKYLSQISESDFNSIFIQNINIPLAEERFIILHEIGESISNNAGGSFSNLVMIAHNDVVKMLYLLLKYIPSLNDESILASEKVYFYKRAQLLISDVHYLFGMVDHRYRFNNISVLTACADYKIPQVLSHHGILEYSKSLENKIKSNVELKKGSVEELEIRANTIWAVEEIKNSLKRQGVNATSSQISDFLWISSQNKSIYREPYHRTITTSY